MNRLQFLKSALVGGASIIAIANPASAKLFDIPGGDLATALGVYMHQSGAQIAFSDNAVRGHHTQGAKGNYSEMAALTQILQGTGFTAKTTASNTIGIVPQPPAAAAEVKVAQAAKPGAPVPAQQSALETVVVTAQKKTEDIQTVPIAVTALTQQQLTERQIAGGPDLVKEIPNLTFSKTNFTGYNLEIRGIGTQAISVTTDPAVAVAFNDIPFIRNHFFEQEFFDVDNVEVLRGPQGTLYGRNATAGVVNVISAKPTDQYEAMLSADVGNYENRRLEGMVNIPIVGDTLDIRLAGEWTKRNGYTEDTELNTSVDGRDLWSGRFSMAWKPSSNIQTDFVWERFSEDDDRMRSGKQLCEKDPGPTSVGGLDLATLGSYFQGFAQTWLSQGCLPTSLYSKSAFETPNGQTLPFVELGEFIVETASGPGGAFLNEIDPYANQTQSTNLRDIQSLILPHYRAKNDTLEFNINYEVTPTLTLISETGYNNDSLFSTEDFNRFDTAPGIFNEGIGIGPFGQPSPVGPNGVYCDPQVGCSSSMVAEDLSQERASQFNQELRLTSSFSGPLNFSVGTNYTHYQTVEDYYVFFNLLTAETQFLNGSGPGQYTYCNTAVHSTQGFPLAFDISPTPPFSYYVGKSVEWSSVFGCSAVQGLGPSGAQGTYIDPNPIGHLNGDGHAYFRSENPYALNSWAGFGEAYYDITPILKLTGGLRWTDDRKVFTDIPSQTFVLGGGYPVAGLVKQGWDEWTGRANASWSPQIDFADESMFYASYAHGYKGGGANPPGPTTDITSGQSYLTHPPTFAPEHIEAFEVGTKNTALDGSLTLNGDVFYYNYHGYQISQIVDRTSVNLNFNATVEGAELESSWEPMPGLKFNFAGGYENSAVDKNQFAIDLMDRTASVPGWVIVRPFPSETSNCILPAAVVAQILNVDPAPSPLGQGLAGACDAAYGSQQGLTSVFGGEDKAAFAAVGFNPATAPNDGQGFAKNLSGNKLPNSPPFTLSTGAQYSMPVGGDWAATLRADFYWQGNSYARIFNDKPYDDIHGYTNLNLALILASDNGWQVMGYVKNVFNVTAITGTFLNSDDTALTTNVFLTDPRLFGVRVTKQLDDNEGLWGNSWTGADLFTGIFSDKDGGRPPVWIELGGSLDQLANSQQSFAPPFLAAIPGNLGSPRSEEQPLGIGLDWESKITFQPDDSDWVISAAVRYGRSAKNAHIRNQTNPPTHLGTNKYGGAVNFPARYQETNAQIADTHEVLDFLAGKDVGLGLPGTSQLSFGARYAALTSTSDISIGADPDSVHNPTAVPRYHYHKFDASLDAKRSFRGIGPSISWNASMPVAGNEADSAFSFDWGANGALLFGKQKARGTHSTAGGYYCSNNVGHQTTGCPVPTANHIAAANHTRPNNHSNDISHYQRSGAFDRSRSMLVPNLGAFVGMSLHYSNAKFSFGYRADEFFGAMDGGVDARKNESVGFFGPFASISVGLGG